MAEHHCPLCGVAHDDGAEPVVDVASEPEPSPDATAAVEAVTEVATAALETVAKVVHEHEETERTEAIADALETVAEEETAQTEAVADAVESVAEEHSEETVATETEPAAEPVVEAEPTEAEAVELRDAEPTPIDVPPQESEPGRAPSSRRQVSAFRRRRVHHR